MLTALFNSYPYFAAEPEDWRSSDRNRSIPASGTQTVWTAKPLLVVNLEDDAEPRPPRGHPAGPAVVSLVPPQPRCSRTPVRHWEQQEGWALHPR
eukprot:277587-Amphidinium_carterae.1